MRTAFAAFLACAGLTLMAGCGSSSSQSSQSGTSAAATSTSTTPASGGLKATTTPKFAAPSSSAPVRSGLVNVAYRNITINPDTVRVKVGSTIKWTDYDDVTHNVTSVKGPQKFASKDFGEGASYEVKLTKPGVINYECSLHPASMNGSIEVVK
jgi:plastocyanin